MAKHTRCISAGASFCISKLGLIATNASIEECHPRIGLKWIGILCEIWLSGIELSKEKILLCGASEGESEKETNKMKRTREMVNLKKL